MHCKEVNDAHVAMKFPDVVINECIIYEELSLKVVLYGICNSNFEITIVAV